MSTNGPQQKDYTDLARLYLRRNNSQADMQAFKREYIKIQDNPNEVQLFQNTVKLFVAQLKLARQKAALKVQEKRVDDQIQGIDQKTEILHERQRQLDSDFSQSVAQETVKIVDSTLGSSSKATTNGY